MDTDAKNLTGCVLMLALLVAAGIFDVHAVWLIAGFACGVLVNESKE